MFAVHFMTVLHSNSCYMIFIIENIRWVSLLPFVKTQLEIFLVSLKLVSRNQWARLSRQSN